ncbi:MAG: hypothetical protein OXE86_11080 [Alphaproteobacteria bacterium]|nr:hypothetical protein [Alphaproteobacteria bacterium]
MKYGAGLIALALLAGLSADASAAEFSYSYLEVTADLSKTKNTATAPLEDDADGRLIGIAGSWEVFDSIYIKGTWSRETKEFGNEVAGVPLDLESRQTLAMLGAGYHFEPGERLSVYAEALAIVDFKVEHTVPLVTRSARGPAAVTTTDSVIEGDGLAAALGVRYRVDENVELEGQLSHMRTEADILRTGGDISDSETMLRIGGQFYTGHGLSVGGYFSYSKHTDDNFDHIRKLGAFLRYYF